MLKFIPIFLVIFLLTSCYLTKQEPDPDHLVFSQLASPALSGSKFPYFLVHEEQLYMSWVEEKEKVNYLYISFYENGKWSEKEEMVAGRDWFVNWADFPEIFIDPKGNIYTHHLQKNGESTYAYGVEVSRKSQDSKDFVRLGTPYGDTSQTEHGFVSFVSLDQNQQAMVWLDGRKYADGNKEMSLRAAKIDQEGNFFDEQVLDERTCDCCQTDIAKTSSGAIVVYRDRSETEVRDIYKVLYKNGKWTKPKPVVWDGWEVFGCPVNGPAVAAQGDLVAVAWFTGAMEEKAVYVSFSRDAGESFGLAIRADLGDPQGRVDLVWADQERIYVSWMENNAENESQVMIRRIALDGNVHEPQVVSKLSASRASGFPVMAKVGESIYLAWTSEEEPSKIELWKSKD